MISIEGLTDRFQEMKVCSKTIFVPDVARMLKLFLRGGHVLLVWNKPDHTQEITLFQVTMHPGSEK